MTIVQAISSGLRVTWRNKWLVLLFFACNLLMAAAIAAPMHAAIADHVGNSAIGEQLARGFDWGWLTEFQVANRGFLKAFSTAIVYGSILFLILNTLLSAGAFEVFRRRLLESSEDASVSGLRTFGSGMGGYFLRFARIIIVASFFYFLAFWIWQGPVLDLLDRAFEDSAIERWHFYLNWLRIALMLLTVSFINIVVDYAKADVVLDEHPSVLAALGHAAGFVYANLRRVFAIYLTLGICAALMIVLYATFARYFPQSSALTIFAWFVVAQVCIAVRWFFRLASWGSVFAYYNSANRKVPHALQPEPPQAVAASQ